MKEVILIDGRNYCYRHSFTRMQLFSRNRPTGAIYGALSGLIRLHRYFPNAAIVFCWDGKNAQKSWRHRLAKDYKANRNKANEETPLQVKWIRQQIPIVEAFVKKFGFRNFSVPNLEADDLIGIIATHLKKTHKVYIYSTDKDFYQLINQKNILVIRDFDKSQDCKPVTDKEIEKRWKVKTSNWLHYRSLVGEKTDNIAKPMPGIGPVKALKMLAEGVDPSSDTPHPNYKAHWQKIRLCYKLTKIVRKINDSRLSKISKVQLRIILTDISKGSLFRSGTSKTKKKYKWMLRFLADYELADIIERRDQLWHIK